MQLTKEDQHILSLLGTYIPRPIPKKIGIAVSGGSDSIALLNLLALWSKEHKVQLEVATVDHGLRPEAAQEAAFVAKSCADLSIQHFTLKWQGWDKTGNLQDHARRARYRLLSAWGQERGIGLIAVGHTKNDQAENFLLRLARKSGVDGLAALAPVFRRNEMLFIRPLALQGRHELRAFLTHHNITWIEDPSNEDQTFDRVKARHALVHLEKLGIGVDQLSDVSHLLGDARHALEWFAREHAKTCLILDGGDIVIRKAEFFDAPDEIIHRLMSHALCWVSSAPYRPRHDPLNDLMVDAQKDDLLSNEQGSINKTLHGCLITLNKSEIRITREYNAVKALAVPTTEIWDNRWHLSGSHAPDLEIRALGADGLKNCPDWRDASLPRSSLLVSPAVWRGDALIAAPLANLHNNWIAALSRDEKQLYSSILSH